MLQKSPHLWKHNSDVTFTHMGATLPWPPGRRVGWGVRGQKPAITAIACQEFVNIFFKVFLIINSHNGVDIDGLELEPGIQHS